MHALYVRIGEPTAFLGRWDITWTSHFLASRSSWLAPIGDHSPHLHPYPVHLQSIVLDVYLEDAIGPRLHASRNSLPRSLCHNVS